MEIWSNIALILGAYLLGSAPHLVALSKIRGINLNGDLHISLWRKGGRLVGTIGILFEFARGIIPVLVGRSLDFSLLVVTLAGLAAVIGQMWPIFLQFDGEKGNSIGLAMAAALAPYPLLIALVPVTIGVAIRTVPRLLDSRQSLNERLKFGGPPSRSLALGMAIGFVMLPVASWWLREPMVITLGFLLLFILIMVRRLTAGLRGDLAVSTRIRNILVNRLLYDRSYR
jgi:glycerol-3-phosphate acyltransferase PlsY